MIVSSCLQVDLIYHYCNRRNSFRYFSALINIISIVKIILCTACFFFFMCKRPQLMRMTLLGPLRVQTPWSGTKYFFLPHNIFGSICHWTGPLLGPESLSWKLMGFKCEKSRHFGKRTKNYVIGKIKPFSKGLAVTDQGIGAKAQVTYLHFLLIFPISFYQQNQYILAISQLTGNTIHFQKENSIYFVIKINIFFKCN